MSTWNAIRLPNLFFNFGGSTPVPLWWCALLKCLNVRSDFPIANDTSRDSQNKHHSCRSDLNVTLYQSSFPDARQL